MKMRNAILLFAAFLLFLSLDAFTQCEPMTPEECPDPENNGQVCPDSLEIAFINQFYSQVATIKPPAVYITPDSIEINLLHVKLMEVGNLPEGIAWQSNSPDSIFVAGEYYCVLMEGTPVEAGDYALRITVDVYISFFGTPVKVATVTDSTSLTLSVVDDSGIFNGKYSSAYLAQSRPNPFQNVTRISFENESEGFIGLKIYDLVGNCVFSDRFYALEGKMEYEYDGSSIPGGTYLYRLIFDDHTAGGIMIKAH